MWMFFIVIFCSHKIHGIAGLFLDIFLSGLLCPFRLKELPKNENDLGIIYPKILSVTVNFAELMTIRHGEYFVMKIFLTRASFSSTLPSTSIGDML